MSDAWNLGDGLENVCRSVLRKAHYASHQTEERPRTIINLDAYEITALIWAMDEYIRKGESDENYRWHFANCVNRGYGDATISCFVSALGRGVRHLSEEQKKGDRNETA